MATLNITEYANMAVDFRNNIVPVGEEPALGRQTVTYTTSTQSDDLHPKTRFVRVISDADGYLVFGVSPTAVASSTRIEADVAEYFGVEIVRNRTIRIAVYDGTT